MRLVQAALVSLALMSTAASADMDIVHMQVASGLGSIVSGAAACGYKVNEQALADYYIKSGLGTPEGLAYINGQMALNKFGNKPSASECTLVKATAKSLGLVIE